MYVCSCFGITEQQVHDHVAAGACTPRDIASRSKAGTDCGSCVRRIQGLLGRGDCSRREALRARLEQLPPAPAPAAAAATGPRTEPPAVPPAGSPLVPAPLEPAIA